MKIPVILEVADLMFKDDFEDGLIQYKHLEYWNITAPKSLKACVKNNIDLFSGEELQLIDDLLRDAADVSNRILAFGIISAKPERDENDTKPI